MSIPTRAGDKPERLGHTGIVSVDRVFDVAKNDRTTRRGAVARGVEIERSTCAGRQKLGGTSPPHAVNSYSS